MTAARAAPPAPAPWAAASSSIDPEAALADRLLAGGRLDEASLERARRARRADGDGLADILMKLGIVSERDLWAEIAAVAGVAPLDPHGFPEMPLFEADLNPKYLRRARVLPVADTPEGVVLAMANPLDQDAIRFMRTVLDRPILPRVALPSEIETALERLYEGGQRPQDPVASDFAADLDDGTLDDVDRLRDLASEAPVIRLVNALIARAVEGRASDIHIEPFQARLAVRYRIDGQMREQPGPPSNLRAAVISRIKIMAKLNIAERRMPQDGRFRVAIRGREYDLRVATVPTLHGEAVTMRVLDRASLVHDFRALGFAADTLERYLKVLTQPQGIVLVTGPTGSGKTTTLYTSLMRLNRPEQKLFTVEDPIEYQLEGVNQVQVNPQIGLSFAEVLRTLLRHNPDIVMIGEMRDLETAQIAVQAALTGHLVLSTLHTNSAAASITRLLDMKVEDYLVTSTLNAVVAQRLVRTLCRTCRAPTEAPMEVLRHAGLANADERDPVVVYRAVGCDQCGHTGYHGQIALMELLVMSDALRRLVLRRAEANEIHQVAVAEGMRPMYEDGLRQVRDGITTLEEVLRVTRAV
ncbi:MAG: Flp pilus assembly complex ATPase component TadA [Rhodospirillales bacterium]|jgi:general secretion pathway protein E|nr:Flp pilus assembly complex ATPase component TadA [Rhodospirillales bacterium]